MVKQSTDLSPGGNNDHEKSGSDLDQKGTQANSANLTMVELDGEDFGDMDEEMSGMGHSHMNSELEPGSSPDKPEAANMQADEHYLADRAKKQTGLDQIKESVKELHEVIAYMDYSFERAFTIQEKEYMLAYRYHAHEIQKDIDELKVDPADHAKQEKEKERKILLFQQRLHKIRSSALWLDHITQAHTDDSKARRKRIKEVEDDMVFLQEKLLHEKVIRQQHKKTLYYQRKEFDNLYLKAQEFIQTSDDPDKVQELLDLLDEEQRSELMSQYRGKTLSSQKSRQMVNFTTASFKKYDSVRVVNLVQTLQSHNLPDQQFAHEVQSYYNYHVERKQNVIDCLRDQVLVQKQLQRKLMEDQHRHNNWLPQKTRNQNLSQIEGGNANTNFMMTKPLLALLMEHLNAMKKELRQRRALTVLQNVKSTKIKPNHLRKSELTQQVTVAQFKPQDRKNLLKNFFGDERVQILVSQVLIKHSGITNQSQVDVAADSIMINSQEQPQVLPAQRNPTLRASQDQVNLASDLQTQFYMSKDPKLNMSDINTGAHQHTGQTPQRGFSAVLSQKTAASSNFYGHQMIQNPTQAQILPQYSTAVIGGGGPNIYDRLLNDSNENLLRPTAHMIGSANRISASFIRPQNWMSQNNLVTKKRQLASANIRQRGNRILQQQQNRPYTNTTGNHTMINKSAAGLNNLGQQQRAYSSQGNRTVISSKRQNQHGTMYQLNKSSALASAGQKSQANHNMHHQTASNQHQPFIHKPRNQSSVTYSSNLYQSVYDRQKSNPAFQRQF